MQNELGGPCRSEAIGEEVYYLLLVSTVDGITSDKKKFTRRASCMESVQS